MGASVSTTPVNLAALLDRLGAVLSHHIAQRTGQPWTVRLLPERNGGLEFRFQNGAERLNLLWGEGRDGNTLEGLPGIFSYTRVELSRSGATADSLVALLAQALRTVTARENFSLLLPPALEASPLSRQVALHRIRQTLETLANRWEDLRLGEIRNRDGNLLLTYVSDREPSCSYRFRIGPAVADASRAHTAVPPLLLRRGFGLYPAGDLDLSPEDQRGQVLLGLLSFCLIRAVPQVKPDSSRPSRDPELGDDNPVSSAIRAEFRLVSPDSYFTAPLDMRWRLFMAEGEIDRLICYQWMSDPLFLTLQHAERGCINMRPMLHTPLRRIYTYPLPLVGSVPEDGVPFMFSDFTEDALALHGDEARLSELVEYAVAHKAADRVLVLRKTCVPRLLGRDTRRQIEQHERELNCRIHTFHPEDDFNPPHKALAQLVNSVAQQSPPQSPDRPASGVCLVGYEQGRYRDELVALLGELGVPVTQFLIPELDLAGLSGRTRPALRVFRPYAGWENLYRELFQKAPGLSISPDAPYGVAATLGWLRSICTALEERQALERLTDMEGEWTRRAETWRASHPGHRLAFVTGCESLGRIWDGPRNHGLSMLRFLREFGFPLLAHVFVPAEWRHLESPLRRKAHAVIAAHGFSPEDLEIDIFSSPEELRELLAGDGSRAVYSDNSLDYRIYAEGKGVFSLADIEKGLTGAERSFQRLRARCESRFAFYYQKARLAHDT